MKIVKLILKFDADTKNTAHFIMCYVHIIKYQVINASGRPISTDGICDGLLGCQRMMRLA